MDNNIWIFQRLSNKHDNFAYKFYGSVHWLHGLSELSKRNADEILTFYDKITELTLTPSQINKTFESLLMSLHYLDALKSLRVIENEYQSISRIGIIAWYYGIYNSCKAMLAVTNGTIPSSHQDTADEWYKRIAKNNLVIHPFDYTVSSLVKKLMKKK